MLNEHSRLSVPNESWFIPTLTQRFPRKQPLTKAQLQEAIELIATNKRWRIRMGYNVADKELRRLVLSLKIPTVACIVDAIFRHFGNPHRKPRWGDKTPEYVNHIWSLHALFRDAKFVHIVRDGRDVSVSLRRTGWHGPTILHSAIYWHKAIKAGREAERELGPSHYLEIKYEDLVLETKAVLERICSFLGERFEERMLFFYEDAAQEVAPGVQRAHAKTCRAPVPADILRWPHEMNGLQVAMFEMIAGQTLNELGYEKRYPRWIPSSISRSSVKLVELVRPARRRLLQQSRFLQKRI
jgi:hypothetical protein